MSHSVNPRPFKQMKDHTNALKRYAVPTVGLLAMMLRGCPVPVTVEVKVAIDSLLSALGSEDVQKIGERVLGLLSRLWQHPWTPLVDHRISDPTMVYLALSSLEETGKFLCAKDLTSVIAKLEYAMRLVFLSVLRQDEDQEDGYQKIRPFIKEGVECTFNSLRNAQRQASTIAFLSQSLPKVWWLDQKDYQELLYKGTHLRIDQLRQLLSALEAKMQQVWEEEVLLGLGLRVEYKEIFDDLANTDVGYSLLVDPRNACFSDQHLLLRTLLSHPALTQRFLLLNLGGAIRFNVHTGRAWLNQLALFHKLLLLRCYLTGGSPARGTEMVAMLLRNTATYPLRNLVAFGPYLSLNCTYLKTSSLTGHDKVVPHALDAFSSDLLVQELAIARPFACVMAAACYPLHPNVPRLFTKHVFVNHTRLFETGDISDALQQFSIEHLNIELGVSDWRHVGTAFRRKLCPRLQVALEEDDEESIAALQMGHSRQTDNRAYGVSQEALQGAAEDVFPLFLEASTDWQVVLQVVPGGVGLPYAEALMSSFPTHVESGLISTKGVKSSLEERLDSLEAKIDRIVGNFSERRSLPSAPVGALDALRSLLKQPLATWKSLGQKEAIQAVLDRQRDVIAILPTNAGKSMVALIPPLVERSGVTVVVLPLLILIMDFERKLKGMGIPFHTFTGQARIHLDRGCNLILISADRLKTNPWLQALAILHHQRPVTRVIVDEAHIPLLSEGFRPALRSMSDVRATLAFQLVLLTASGHRELLAALKAGYGVGRDAIVVHEPSNRPELEYVWRSVKDVRGMVDAIQEAIQQSLATNEDRAIVFVPWKELGEHLARELRCSFYHGGNPGNPDIYHAWLTGLCPTVVATSAFGTGNDYPSVRLVVHAGAPYEMVNYVQEVSRAGRDGSSALCLLLLPSDAHVRVSAPVRHDLTGSEYLSKAVQRPNAQCVRQAITTFCDGLGVECSSDPKNRLCSHCRCESMER